MNSDSLTRFGFYPLFFKCPEQLRLQRKRIIFITSHQRQKTHSQYLTKLDTLLVK